MSSDDSPRFMKSAGRSATASRAIFFAIHHYPQQLCTAFGTPAFGGLYFPRRVL